MTTATIPATATVAPVQQAERIQIVDILRGFALFGILLVNMAIFSYPFQAILFPADPDMPWYDRAATWLIHFLAEGTFYAIFSLLFGLGMILLLIPFSHWWMKRFRYSPAEWLWRSMTYWKWQPMRRNV